MIEKTRNYIIKESERLVKGAYYLFVDRMKNWSYLISVIRQFVKPNQSYFQSKNLKCSEFSLWGDQRKKLMGSK